MMDSPLTITSLLRHGAQVYGDSEVRTFEGEGCRSATYRQVADRCERLAAALTRLGVGAGDRVATFGWNTQEHLEAYLAVPSMGAVLHTLNIRLFPEQLVYIANHAGDKVVLVDASLVPLFAKIRAQLTTVEHIVVIGDGDASTLGEVLRYDALLAAEKPGFAWPDLDERTAAAMCYTSGTTGHPKGVVYSHRSNVLHSYGVNSASAFGLTEADRLLPIVPMFHANAWGLPYAGFMAGVDFIMPGRFLQPEPMCKLIRSERPTVSGGVPTVWTDVMRHVEAHGGDLSSFRLIVCGGSAVPRALIERFQERAGVRLVQAWGMTETSPLAAMARAPRNTAPADEMNWRERTGRIAAGVELRLCDDAGTVLPWDGQSVGEIEVRGPWITASYYKDPAPEKFHDGWLRTGDVGTVCDKGFIRITDRAKDVIKSGGEWIPSVELENAIMGHPEVLEAAVIGVPDTRWQERPLACVVRRDGSSVGPDELRAFLTDKVAHWWLPERWSFIEQVPRTSVGKFDKKVLRARFGTGELVYVGPRSP
ncbi:MAG: acyl-CoA synthetase (AMP-forming)/AMP-acid ligase [Myxococcales bacterium]|nr:acyl-CoA synthetase (AMP-forming)/AMP-acid ligase [Myxococcales bacterium]